MRYAYKNELITLYSLFEFLKNLQLKLVIPSEADWNVKDAILIFNQTIDSMGLVLSSLPESPIDSGYKCFSPSLVASQGRIMIDHYLSIAYLFSAKDKEMHEFQELIWNQGIDFKRWYLVSNYNPDNPELQNMRDKLEKNEIKIRNHSFFFEIN